MRFFFLFLKELVELSKSLRRSYLNYIEEVSTNLHLSDSSS